MEWPRFDELHDAAHEEIAGRKRDGERLMRAWHRPAQVLIDYVEALEVLVIAGEGGRAAVKEHRGALCRLAKSDRS